VAALDRLFELLSAPEVLATMPARPPGSPFDAILADVRKQLADFDKQLAANGFIFPEPDSRAEGASGRTARGLRPAGKPE
jgi:hypothetical protein